MTDVKKPIRGALEKLEEMQSFESSYAEINKVQAILNTFANLEYAAELMADEIGEKTGQSREEVLEKYYRLAGILND